MNDTPRKRRYPPTVVVEGYLDVCLGRGPSLTKRAHAHHEAWPSPVRGASLPRSIRQRGDSRPGRAFDHDLMEHPGTGAATNSCGAAATSTDCDGDEKSRQVALLARATLSPPALAPKRPGEN